MTATFRSHLTRAAALLLGLALGWGGSRQEAAATLDGGNGPRRPEKESAKFSADSKPANKLPRSDGEGPFEPTEAYAAAWDLLKDGRHSIVERRAIQAKLLEEWALVDIASALRAAFSEPANSYIDGEKTLRDCCLEGIRRQPDLVWSLVLGGSFGFEQRKLSQLWLKAMREQDPVAILECYPDLPEWELEIRPYESNDPFSRSPDAIFDDEPSPWRAPESYPLRAQVISDLLHEAHISGREPEEVLRIMKGVARLAKGADGDKVIAMSDKVLGQILSMDSVVGACQAAGDAEVRNLYFRGLLEKFAWVEDGARAKMLDELPPALRTEVAAALQPARR